MHKLRNAWPGTFDPAMVERVARTYQVALGEIAAGCGYLPPRECRRAIASRIVAKAGAGERDPERLKIWGLAAIEDMDGLPLALAFAALLRRAAVTAAKPDEA